MNLYLISQTANQDYDTYDSAVVATTTEDKARHIVPGGGNFGESYNCWCNSPNEVSIKLIGQASPDVVEGVVCSSF